MENKDIRQAISKSGHYQWEVAEMLGISECHFSRQLRRELPQEKKLDIYNAIEQLKAKEGQTW